jgi:integrase
MKFVSAPVASEYEAISMSGTEAASVITRLRDPLLKTLVILIAATGMRISEALALTWSVVNWRKGKIRIVRKFAYGAYGKPKSRMSAKPVEMSPGLATVLQAWRGETMYGSDSDLIFPSYRLAGKAPRSKGMAAKVVRQAAIDAGVLEVKDEQALYDGQPVVRFGFHNLRHGIATWLAEQGTDPVVIQRMLRHADTNMTMHYVHASKQARKAQEQYITELGVNHHYGYTLRVQ